jgi:hypothetical protein
MVEVAGDLLIEIKVDPWVCRGCAEAVFPKVMTKRVACDRVRVLLAIVIRNEVRGRADTYLAAYGYIVQQIGDGV